MENAINKPFQFNGIYLVAKQTTNQCKGCYFAEKERGGKTTFCTNYHRSITGLCGRDDRTDLTHVIFKQYIRK